MSRELTGHRINPANQELSITAVDEPGEGGANHAYIINDSKNNHSFKSTLILFQNGPIKEVGVNGITHETLLEIIIDRLKSFQNGKFSCIENQLALTRLEEAKEWLLLRTKKRMEKGIEGTHQI